MKYQYCSRDLHFKPEKYHFSNSGGSSFIKSFIKLRELRIEKLIELWRSTPESYQLCENSSALFPLFTNQTCLGEFSDLAQHLDNKDTQTIRPTIKSIESNRSIDTKKLLDQVLLSQINQRIKSSEEKTLDRLVKKFEVSRRIHNSYDMDFRKKSSPTDDMFSYSLLAINLLVRFQEIQNFKFLNAALKVNDMLITQPAPKSLDCISLFIACSSIECSIVTSLCERHSLSLK